MNLLESKQVNNMYLISSGKENNHLIISIIFNAIGVREGDDVSVHYDPMLAKLIAWGEDRNQAFTKLRNKLVEFNVRDILTNSFFHKITEP